MCELNTTGKHLLVEYKGCEFDALNNVNRIQELMETAARAAEASIVASVFQPFEPQGVSGVVVISESHLSIHTWPEDGYAAVDFYTCGCCDPYAAHAVLTAGLGASNCEVIEVARGLNTNPLGPRSMTFVQSRQLEEPVSASFR